MLRLCCAHLLSLHCRQAQTDRDGASNHEMNFCAQYLEILSLEGHQNDIIGSKVTAILLNMTLSQKSGYNGIVHHNCVIYMCRFRFIKLIEHRSKWIGIKTYKKLIKIPLRVEIFFSILKSVVIRAVWEGVGPTVTAQVFPLYMLLI